MIYVDMDGVLADFTAHACAIHGRADYEVKTWDFYEDWGLTGDQFWDPIHAAKLDFWEGLPVLPWAHELLEVVKEFEPNFELLTTPCLGNYVRKGKSHWVDRHLTCFPRLNFATDGKGEWHKKHGQPGDILIDDHDENLSAWASAGGIAIPFPQAWNRGHGEVDQLHPHPVGYVTKKLREYLPKSPKENTTF